MLFRLLTMASTPMPDPVYCLQGSTFQKQCTKLEERQILGEKQRLQVVRNKQLKLVEEGRLDKEQQRREVEEGYLHLEQLILAKEKRLLEEDLEELRLEELRRLEDEERLQQKAGQRCANMIIALTQGEETQVRDALYAEGETVVNGQIHGSVSQQSIATLKDGVWLGDEVCNYMLQLILKREEVMCGENPCRKRSSCFWSFFLTKLMNQDHASENGIYKFENVKSWSKRVNQGDTLHGDIFNLDKLFVPINEDKQHWVVVVVFFEQKRIQVFDSLYTESGKKHLEVVFRYIQDEHQRKHGTELPEAAKWALVTSKGTAPRQTNSESLKNVRSS